MKPFLISLLALIAITSCKHKTGSGNIVTETRSTGSFDAVSVGGSIDAEIKTGDATQVKVEADDNLIRYVETRVEGGTLKIRTKSNVSFSNAHIRLYVTAPVISSIKAAASADVVASGTLTGNKISFKASSSASIRAEVDAPEIESEASSSATIVLSGRTRNHRTQASSSADIKAFQLLSENTTATASSSATIEVFASVKLDARASSSADIRYRGAATVSRSESSSGSVEKKD